MELATCGISGLDAQLGGGFPRGSTVLVVGDPSNALGVFAEQFCAGGLLQGETVLYVQTDRPAHGAPARIKELAQALGGQPKGPLKVLDGYAAQFGANGHGKLAAGAGDAQALSAENPVGDILNEAMRAGAGRYRLAVDSLSSLALREGKQEEALEFFRHLVHLGRATSGLQLVTLVRGLHEPGLEARLKHLATGVLEIGLERKGFGLYSYLQVTKMLDLRDPTRLLLFKETDKGIWLESTKRVF